MLTPLTPPPKRAAVAAAPLDQALPRAAKLQKLKALVTEKFGEANGPASYGTYYDTDQLYQWLGAGLWSDDHSGRTCFGLALRQVSSVSEPESRRQSGQGHKRKRFVHLMMPRPQVASGGHGRPGQGRGNQEQTKLKMKASTIQKHREEKTEGNEHSAPSCGYRYKPCSRERMPKRRGWFKLCAEHARKANSYKH
jgi:hypothetical protein